MTCATWLNFRSSLKELLPVGPNVDQRGCRGLHMSPSLLLPANSVEELPLNYLRNRDMLCFSHDWSGDPLSKTHLMRLLARNNRILWVNSIGYRAPSVSRRDLGRAFKKLAAAMQPLSQPEPNLFVLSPFVIPAHGL